MLASRCKILLLFEISNSRLIEDDLLIDHLRGKMSLYFFLRTTRDGYTIAIARSKFKHNLISIHYRMIYSWTRILVLDFNRI